MNDRWRRLGYEILLKNLFQHGTTSEMKPVNHFHFISDETSETK